MAQARRKGGESLDIGTDVEIRYAVYEFEEPDKPGEVRPELEHRNITALSKGPYLFVRADQDEQAYGFLETAGYRPDRLGSGGVGEISGWLKWGFDVKQLLEPPAAD